MRPASQPALASSHTLQTAVVLEEHRLLYVPSPKGASTTVLWVLAELAGLSPSDFARSTKPEVTRALTVHDLSIWGSSRRLEGRSSAEVDEILHSGDWFRFTVVRDPTRRLWSAWLSKLLVRDPKFVATFGDEDWFPMPPTSAQDVVDSFRRFVGALAQRPVEWHDRHWSPQSGLVSLDQVRYDYVGRVERLDQTFAVIADHIPGDAAMAPPPRENLAILPFAPQVFDAPTLEASDPLTAPDRKAFGYARLAATTHEPPAAWISTVESSLGAIMAVIDRNERVGDLGRMFGEAPSSTRRLFRRAARRL